MSYEEGTEAAVVAALTTQGATPVEIDDAKVYAFRYANGDVKVIDGRDYGYRPQFASGTFVVRDAESFAQYVNRHGMTRETAIWIDDETYKISAQIDGHEINDAGDPGLPGWQKHKLVLRTAASPEWTAWSQLSGQAVSQAKLAEFFEDQQDVIVDPSAADMLEVAQSLRGRKNVAWESSERMSDGSRVLQYKETAEAKAGQRGTVTIPEIFKIGVAPFVGGKPLLIRCRFIYRMSDGGLTVGFRIINPDQVMKVAFDAIVDDTLSGLDSTEYGTYRGPVNDR